ncbi:glycosyltransferase involved in cell wall biosynthesis [Deinococcus metalli]|uniref:Glycosyl transferase family 1 n=1 Tax=Deinococcus metalli TaxID=1141878 RepID=A0A7W8NR98_9DEIO|nr:glycosyltransferase family 4 protein [Deinococcus metalli]MBB5375922.1 glycosyltransferase involved in cell wall biosynthesis [Deinococcus metalli]GHF36071.1 glycosyl transferase family 1 [Deinococcus metalli]
MKVVMAHTFYKQKGGEDESYRAEARLLEDHGHHVVRYERHNRELDGLPAAQIALKTLWNAQSAREVGLVAADAGADVVHFQNTFPLMSPAVYSAARRRGAAVVQALRNYRHSCVNGLLFRDGHLCESCSGRSFALPGIQHRCYRHSTVGSAVVATMQSTHKLLRTYERHVDLFIAVSGFVRQKYIEFGIDPDRIVVKPNFVYPDPGAQLAPGSYALFVGRLSAEKGVRRLVEVWLRERPGLDLRIVGDGAERGDLEALAGSDARISFLGGLSLPQTYAQIAGAAFVVVPSEWYEPFGRTAIEGLAHGTPVVCSAIGGLAEIVEDGVTGFTFEAGDAESMTAALRRAVSRVDDGQLRVNARAAYERSYSPQANYEILMSAYHHAADHRARH